MSFNFDSLSSWPSRWPVLKPWIGIGTILTLSLALLAIIGECVRRFEPHPESARKALHVGVGTLLLSCPWLFDRPWPVVVLAVAYAGSLFIGHYFSPLQFHVAGVVYGVRRQSRGEYYFPLMVAVMFIAAHGNVLLFFIPISLLVYADATAALIGVQYGRIHFSTPRSRKSVEGSVAFAVVAFGATFVPLVIDGRVAPVRSLIVAATISMVCAAAEAVSWNGFDNVAVPVLAFAILQAS